MNKRTITPAQLRIALSALLLLLTSAGVGVFALGYSQLKTHAAEAQAVAVQAEASRSSLEDLIQVQKFLADNSDVVDRADQLAAQSKLYQYQDQIIGDLNKYATESGLQIANITFDDTKVTTTAPATAATTTTPDTSTAPAAPSGIKSMTASVTIKNPTDYSALLNFIHRIEQSLFRMQVSRVGISQSNDINHPGQITSDAFTIEVYVR